MLTAGDVAPIFKIEDIFGKEVTLLKTDKWTYMSFHRFAACPFCVLRTRELVNAYSLLKQNNIEIVSIWPSGKANMLKYVGREMTPFPLVPDERKVLFEKYFVTKSSGLSVLKLFGKPILLLKALMGKYTDIEVDADPNLLPAEFLISPKGKIAFSYYGKHFGDHMSINQIVDFTTKQGVL